MSTKKSYFGVGFIIILALIGVVWFVKSGHDYRSHINADNPKSKGSIETPVHVVMYSDFQCPACLKAREPVEALLKEFPDSIYFEFRHFPLENAHRWAMTAALFAECAGEQGKFWEYHGMLYDHQAEWAVLDDAIPTFVKFAQSSGLQQAPLEACLGDIKTLERIRKEREGGEKLQVQSTPTIFINEQRLIGGADVTEKGKAIVEEELRKKDKLPAKAATA